ncbi:MAG: ABC transporter substrate-binding protein [Rhodospirillales bacterium]|nr:ABC transporter substrate-binding protein [Rhodospirillales bacterium]MDH3791508.1 ABC transporter substrate-binding protein [Rhodospirillales bacterium]MDH3910785.1 ABC transporter substrate-binding protein [Rhodospirillales bacterium]MDH3917526.1 ABC transporter substrate-binding protein [Rhodospirillales bacterium]MDH3970014.1 ABC transporter substrate-binding protein [Rhodospirillales bacterium]
MQHRFSGVLAVWAILAGLAAPAAAQEATVATTAIVEHPALDAVRDGLRDELAAGGYEVGRNLTFLYESAQGNPATAAQIARKFVGEAPDVIVPISTPSAQTVVAATKDIPVVFTAVTDPLGARLVTSMDKPGGNVTGMTDLSPIAKHMALIKRITPKAGKLGVIFNPGEANSVTLVRLIKQHAPERGLVVVEAPAPKSADVLAAAQSLIGKADAIYVPTDNTVVSALEAVIKVGIDHKVPVYAGDTDSVARGAIAALGFNYYDVGRQTGRIVLRVLKGEAPGEIAVQGVEITELHVNPGVAKMMGVTIPADVIAEAKKVVE